MITHAKQATTQVNGLKGSFANKFIAHFLSQCAKFYFLVDLFSVLLLLVVVRMRQFQLWLLLHIFALLHNGIAIAMSHILQRWAEIKSNILSVWMNVFYEADTLTCCAYTEWRRERERARRLLWSPWNMRFQIYNFFTRKKSTTAAAAAFESNACNIWRNAHWMIGID